MSDHSHTEKIRKPVIYRRRSKEMLPIRKDEVTPKMSRYKKRRHKGGPYLVAVRVGASWWDWDRNLREGLPKRKHSS